MSLWRTLSRGETRIDFVGRRRRWFAISSVLLIVSVASLGARQLNLGIEFVGGLALQSPNPAGATVPEVRGALSDHGAGGATIQLLDDGDAVRIAMESVDQETENRIIEALVEVTGSSRDEVSIEAVGPTFGALVARRALLALAVFLGAVVLFISWRLEFKMAMAGLAALIHDLLLTFGVYSVLDFPVTPATVVAILTILGYSLYDTVVVFDRVEDLVEADEESAYTPLVNRAMNQVLARSLLTSLTSLLPVGSILFVGAMIFGAATLREFALALFVGIAAGTYSSVFIAAPLLAGWKEKEETWRQRAERAERRARAGKTGPRS